MIHSRHKTRHIPLFSRFSQLSVFRFTTFAQQDLLEKFFNCDPEVLLTSQLLPKPLRTTPFLLPILFFDIPCDLPVNFSLIISISLLDTDLSLGIRMITNLQVVLWPNESLVFLVVFQILGASIESRLIVDSRASRRDIQAKFKRKKKKKTEKDEL